MLSVRFELATALRGSDAASPEAGDCIASLSPPSLQTTRNGPEGRDKRSRKSDACGAPETGAADSQREDSTGKRPRLREESTLQRPSESGPGEARKSLLRQHLACNSSSVEAPAGTPAACEEEGAKAARGKGGCGFSGRQAGPEKANEDTIRLPLRRAGASNALRHLLASSWASLTRRAPRWCASRRRENSERSWRPLSPLDASQIRSASSAPSFACRSMTRAHASPPRPRDLHLQGLTADGRCAYIVTNCSVSHCEVSTQGDQAERQAQRSSVRNGVRIRLLDLHRAPRSERGSSVREINASLFLDSDGSEKGLEGPPGEGRRGQDLPACAPRDAQPVVLSAVPVEGLPAGAPQLLALLSVRGDRPAATLHLVVLPTCVVVLSFPLPVSSSSSACAPCSRGRRCWEETYVDYLAKLNGGDIKEQHQLVGAAAVFDEETQETLLTIATRQAGVFVFSNCAPSSASASLSLRFSPVLCLLPPPDACSAFAFEKKESTEWLSRAANRLARPDPPFLLLESLHRGGATSQESGRFLWTETGAAPVALTTEHGSLVDACSSSRLSPARGSPANFASETSRWTPVSCLLRYLPVPSRCVHVTSVAACAGNTAELASLSFEKTLETTREASAKKASTRLLGSFFLSTSFACRKAFCTTSHPLVVYIQPKAWGAASAPPPGLADSDPWRRTAVEKPRQFVVVSLAAPASRTADSSSCADLFPEPCESSLSPGPPPTIPACATELHRALGTLAGAAGRGLAVRHLLAAIPYAPFAGSFPRWTPSSPLQGLCSPDPSPVPCSSLSPLAHAPSSGDARALAALAERQATEALSPRCRLEHGLWLVGRCADGRLAVMHAFVRRSVSRGADRNEGETSQSEVPADAERLRGTCPHRRTIAAAGVYALPEVQLASDEWRSFACDACNEGLVFTTGLQAPAWQRVGEPGAALVAAHVCPETHALALVWLARPECTRTLVYVQQRIFGEALEGTRRVARKSLQPAFQMTLFPVPIASCQPEGRGPAGAGAEPREQESGDAETRVEADADRRLTWSRRAQGTDGPPDIVAGVALEALLPRESPLSFAEAPREEGPRAKKTHAGRKGGQGEEREDESRADERDKEGEDEVYRCRDLFLARREAGESKETEAILWSLLQPLTPGELRMKSQVGTQALRAIAQSAASVFSAPASLRVLSCTYTPPSETNVPFSAAQAGEQSDSQKDAFQFLFNEKGERSRPAGAKGVSRVSQTDDSLPSSPPSRAFAVPDNPGWIKTFSLTFALLGVCGDHHRSPALAPSDLTGHLSPPSSSSSPVSSSVSSSFHCSSGVHTPRSSTDRESGDSDSVATSEEVPDEPVPAGRDALSIRLDKHASPRKSEDVCMRGVVIDATDADPASGGSGRPFCACPSPVSVSSDSWQGDSESEEERERQDCSRGGDSLTCTYADDGELDRHRRVSLEQQAFQKAGKGLLVGIVLHAEAEVVAIQKCLERRALDIFTTPAVYCRPLQCLGLLPAHIQPSDPLVAFDLLATKGAITLLPRERDINSDILFGSEHGSQGLELGFQESQTKRFKAASVGHLESRATARRRLSRALLESLPATSPASPSDGVQVYVHLKDQRLLHALLQVYVHRGEAAALQRVLLAPAAAGKRRLGKTMPLHVFPDRPHAEAWAFSDAFVLLVTNWALSKLDAILELAPGSRDTSSSFSSFSSFSSSSSSSCAFPVVSDLLDMALRAVDLAESLRRNKCQGSFEASAERLAAHLVSQARAAVLAASPEKPSAPACASWRVNRDIAAWSWWRLVNPKQLRLLRGLEAVLSACLIRLTNMVSDSSPLLSSTLACPSWPRTTFDDGCPVTSPSSSSFATPLPSPVRSPSCSSSSPLLSSSSAAAESSSSPGAPTAAPEREASRDLPSSSRFESARGERLPGVAQRLSGEAAADGVVGLPPLAAFLRSTLSSLALLHAVFWWSRQSRCSARMPGTETLRDNFGGTSRDTSPVSLRASRSSHAAPSVRVPAEKRLHLKQAACTRRGRKTDRRGDDARDRRGDRSDGGNSNAWEHQTNEAGACVDLKEPAEAEKTRKQEKEGASISSSTKDARLVRHLVGLSHCFAFLSGEQKPKGKMREALLSVPAFLQPLGLLAWPCDMRDASERDRKQSQESVRGRDHGERRRGGSSPRERTLTPAKRERREIPTRNRGDKTCGSLFAALARSKAAEIEANPLFAVLSGLQDEAGKPELSETHVSGDAGKTPLASAAFEPRTADAFTGLQLVDLLTEVAFPRKAREASACREERAETIGLLSDAQKLFFPAALELLRALPRGGVLGGRLQGEKKREGSEESKQREEDPEGTEGEKTEKTEAAGFFEILALLCNSLLYFQQAINLYSWVCSRVARRSGASDFSSFPSSSPPFVHTILAYLLLLSNEVSRVALATSYIPLRSLLSSSPSSLSSSPSSLSSSPSSLSSSSPCPSSSLSCSSRSSSPPSKPGASSSLLSASLSSVSSSSVGSGERRLRRNRDLRGLAAKATLLGEKARLSVWRTAERAVKALLSGLQLQQAVRCSVAVDALSALSLLPDIPGEQLRGRSGTRLKAQTEENGEKEERQEKREDENSLLHLRSAVALDLLLSRLEIEMQTDFCKREDMFSLSTVDESESSLWRMKSFGSLPNPLSALSQFGLLFLSMSLHHAPAGDSSSPSSPPPHVSSCQSFLLSGEQGDPASRSAASSLAASSLAAVYRARALSHLRGLLSSFLSAVELNAPLLPPPHPLSLSVSSLFSPLALSFRRASDATFARSLFSTSSERLLSAQQATWERAGKMAAAVSLLLALRLSFFSTARAILSSWDVPACGAASLPTHATKKQNTDTSGPADEFPREGDPAAKRHGRERSSDFLHALVRGSLYTGTFAALRRVVCDDRGGAFRQSALFSSLLDLLRRAVRHSQTFAAADNVQPASPPALALTPSSPSGEPKREENNRLLLTATRAAVEILLSCAAYGRSANAQEVKALCVSSGQEVFERVAADASDETFFLKAAETLVEKLHARSFPENEVHALRRLLSAE
ncbi:hypothetical protein TGDOM2_267650 [Toxoplasma gondii GAB2-2007-GAL-DOM2]|uniref:Uncharacterized protein n=1 Tax=Toxoplasma gondii GAB2-2007-GAL-DOM2 TaxID=1130820 RepID=A0A086K3C7_TOXGO|nr:hypothetical protein TGDOM2_267650 [Toxoplasma gondii GAB2-2007-GAL-DOM2]